MECHQAFLFLNMLFTAHVCGFPSEMLEVEETGVPSFPGMKTPLGMTSCLGCRGLLRTFGLTLILILTISCPLATCDVSSPGAAQAFCHGPMKSSSSPQGSGEMGFTCMIWASFGFTGPYFNTL